MWTCRRCGKPVYFAERRQSIGFDWHRECLRCQECGKVLNPGQHAEHKETPYCHVPCYSALFGPKLFGHGSQVESHQSFGKRSGQKLLEQLELERKMREYNDYQNIQLHSKESTLSPNTNSLSNEQTGPNSMVRNYSFYGKRGSSRLELTSREVNGRLVLEGVLKVCWGVEHSIRIKEFDDKRLIAKRATQGSQSALSSCDKTTSSVLSGSRQKENFPPTSLDYDCNKISEDADNKKDTFLKRQRGNKDLTPFQRHSVHQISITNKNGTKSGLSCNQINEEDPLENVDIIKENLGHLHISRSLPVPDEDPSRLQEFPKERDQVPEFSTTETPEVANNTPCQLSTDATVQNSSIHTLKNDLSKIDWRKIDTSKAIVERRSSDVTLEKMHAVDRRENETIGAALKKYQTLPPKIALKSLSGFSEYRLHRYAPLMDLATLRPSSSSSVNSSSISMVSLSAQNKSSGKNKMIADDKEIVNTIKKFICLDEVGENRDNLNVPYSVCIPDDSEMGDTTEDGPSKKLDSFLQPESKIVRGTGAKALRRRPGLKFSEKRKAGLQRKSSFNGHWYNRDTSVFTPPKDSYMSVWATSLTKTSEVVKMLTEKYQIQIDTADRFALYVVKDNGERRRLTDSECPLLTRVNLGPHEDAAKIYVMDNRTTDIRHEVAQFLRFSYAELRAIVNMFYEEEEEEIERIRERYKTIKDIMRFRLQSPNVHQTTEGPTKN